MLLIITFASPGIFFSQKNAQSHSRASLTMGLEISSTKGRGCIHSFVGKTFPVSLRESK
jgi:hypothetical protein